MVEGDVGTLDICRLVPAINLDHQSKEELQLAIPYVVWAQDKLSHPWCSSEDAVLLNYLVTTSNADAGVLSVLYA